MPNIKSAIKRVKITQKRNMRNRQVKSKVRTAVRGFETALANNEDAEQKLRRAISEIDRAKSKGVLHANTAARQKSRLTKQFNQAQADVE